MLNRFIAIAVSMAIGLVSVGATLGGELSLRDQILTLDKELLEMRKTTLSDPAVKAAQAELQAALAKLKATEDDALVRTNPKGKEMVEKYRKLLAQYKAQQKASVAKETTKQ